MGAIIEEQLAAWMRQKKYEVDLTQSHTRPRVGVEITTVRNVNTDGRQFRFVLTEQSARDGLWRSEVTASLPHRHRGWVHVAVENESGRTPGAPGITGRLIDVLPDPRDGGMLLSSQPPLLRPDDFDDTLDAICDPDRHGLLLLAGSTRDDLFDKWVNQVREWARPTVGVAQVAVCDPDLTAMLTEHLGERHAISPWTIRTYRAGADPAWAADARRHRILGSERLGTDSDHAIRGLLSRVTRYHANSQPYPLAVTRVFRDLNRIADRELLGRIFTPPSRHVVAARPSPSPSASPSTSVAPAVDAGAETMAGAVSDSEVAAPETGGETTAPEIPSAVPGDTTGPGDAHDRMREDRPGDLVAVDATTLAALHARASTAERRLEVLADVLGDDFDDDALLGLLETATAPARLQGAHDHLAANQELVVNLEEELEEKDRVLVELGDDLLIAEWERVRVADENLWLRGKLRDLEQYEAAAAQLPEDLVTEFPGDFEELVAWLPRLAERGVVFTGDADETRKLVYIDATGKFALAAWEALLVLADYVAARATGAHDTNVELYLKGTPSGFRGMSPKRHAAGETKSTLAQFGHLRDFPVPRAVAASGVARMAAHFKLAHHGMVSPRLHYFDDVSGSGCVYVGYIGEHLRCVTTN